MGKRWLGSQCLLALMGVLFFVGCSKSNSNSLSNSNDSLTAKGATDSCPGAIGDAFLVGKAATSVTHGQVQTELAGTINYTVTSGYLPVYAVGKQSGPIHACMFYFSYTRDDKSGNSAWPVTFLFNGGPGSPSDWVHLGGLGPKTMDFGPEGIQPTTGTLYDDPYTILASSDIVFIDPISTGFSRPAQGIDPSEFNGLNQDADSIGDFINGYLTLNKRTASPKFLIGESYAGMRIPVLSRYLDEKLGIKLTGISFISPWLDAMGDTNFGDFDPADDVPFIGYLPEYATSAWYHHNLSADQQAKDVETIYTEAETYANEGYAEALAQGDDLSYDDKDAAIRQISTLTGLSHDIVANHNLRVGPEVFRVEVVKDQGAVVGYYDGRMQEVVADPNTQDPYDLFNPVFNTADGYFTTTLGVVTDLAYAGNNWNSWPGENAQNQIQGGYLNVLTDITTLLTNNPSLKVYVASGLYDMVCPPAEVHYMIRHLKPEVASRMDIHHFQAGHPIYFGSISHKIFAEDMAKFMASDSSMAIASSR